MQRMTYSAAVRDARVLEAPAFVVSYLLCHTLVCWRHACDEVHLRVWWAALSCADQCYMAT